MLGVVGAILLEKMIHQVCILMWIFFESSLRGWLSQGIELTDLGKRYIPEGIERICLELSARFCADALQNTYFKENRKHSHKLDGTIFIVLWVNSDWHNLFVSNAMIFFQFGMPLCNKAKNKNTPNNGAVL